MKILIIDIETTGFFPEGYIVEIGMVELDTVTGEKKVIFNQLVAEENMSMHELQNSWIVNNSSLTVEEFAEKAVPLEEVKQQVQNLINAYAGVTAYNRKFDIQFLTDRGFTFPRLLPCPMLISTNICKLPKPNGWGGYKWPKVQEAYDFLFPGNTYTEEHRGADDALHEAEIVHELIKRGHYNF
jgi:DNA polymerase-3 subunit epsilon